MEVMRVRVMVFNVTFNNVSVISWRLEVMITSCPEFKIPSNSHFQKFINNIKPQNVLHAVIVFCLSADPPNPWNKLSIINMMTFLYTVSIFGVYLSPSVSFTASKNGSVTD